MRWKRKLSGDKKYTVYRPQLLETDLGRQIIDAQPPQIRFMVHQGQKLLFLVALWAITCGLIGLSIQIDASHQTSLKQTTILSNDLNSKLLSEFGVAPKTEHKSKHHIRKPSVKLSSECRATMVNIVAHEDDDLLFMNPDIASALQAGECVRTIYLTAGDDGRGYEYAQSREAGSQAAYDVMLNNSAGWSYQSLTLFSGRAIQTAAPLNNKNVTLIYLRLPDGNLGGGGFHATGGQSLAALQSGAITDITSFDNQMYSTGQLITTLTVLLQKYQPNTVNTQAHDTGGEISDHSDHIVTGDFATEAFKTYVRLKRQKNTKIQYYTGYPIRGLASNLNETQVNIKSAAFFAYAGDDPGVCTSTIDCEASASTYGQYLTRLYKADR